MWCAASRYPVPPTHYIIIPLLIVKRMWWGLCWGFTLFSLLTVPVFPQAIVDPCTTITNLTGIISGNFTPEICWRITPVVGTSKRPTTISLRFEEFALDENRVSIYRSNSPDSNQLYGVFTGNENPSGNPPTFAIAHTDSLFLYLQGDEEFCSFTFEWTTGKDVELKTAPLVLISVIIMLIIPLICVRVVICTQGKQTKQRQVEHPEYGTRQRMVALWCGMLVGFLFLALLLSRKINL
eukprot:Phypoly_transcript_18462.p1 GENE.Phypoly_transcript_18462~~Phypoly_transcript_18462.p1  ORF type:complete len:238 (+),score=28.86 Phypoly_transcript_18462:15-728(+)